MVRRGLLPCGRLGVAAALALIPIRASAQNVLVRTIETETRRAIGGAIVSLLDSTGTRIGQGLTNESGRLLLRAPTAGRYRLRADRIGHPGVTAELRVTDTASVTLVMPAERIFLPELTVAGSTQCERRDGRGGEQTAALWEEIRKALAASAITTSSQSIELQVRRFRRSRSLTGELRRDSTVGEYNTRASPFVALEPAALRAGGYLQRVDKRWQFFGPDAQLMLSEDFLTDHCFELIAPDQENEKALGLGFRPVQGQTRPDIRGILWVDRTSAELRHLDFEFVNVPRAVEAPIGGRIEFERLGGGAWIIRDWYIRSPDRVSLRRGSRSLLPTHRDWVVGYIDEGGVARPARNLASLFAEVAAQVRESTVEMVDVVGTLVSPEGRPIVGASVVVAAFDSVLTSGDDGTFRLADVPVGRMRFRVLAVGYRPLGVSLQLSNNRRLLDTVITLRRVAHPLDSIVVTGKPTKFLAGKMEDFERRRRMGFGKFLTRAELHDPLQGGLDIQLRRFARIRLVPLPWRAGGGFAAGGSVGGCFLTVYLDGSLYWSPDMPTPPPDITKFGSLSLEGVEVYVGLAETPIEYTGRGSPCGVLLLWTRVT